MVESERIDHVQTERDRQRYGQRQRDMQQRAYYGKARKPLADTKDYFDRVTHSPKRGSAS
jgi:hypothetical protein